MPLDASVHEHIQKILKSIITARRLLICVDGMGHGAAAAAAAR